MTNSNFRIDRRSALALGAAAAVVPVPALAAAPDEPSAPRRRERLDRGWRFHRGHAADMERDFGFGRYQRTFAKPGAETSTATLPGFDDSGWQAVQVPHDWAVDLPYGPPDAVPEGQEDFSAAHGFKAIGRRFPQNSVGWYRRKLDIRPEDRNRAVWIEFDGVFRDSIVFVNGYAAGGSESGYAPFRVEIGDFLDYDGGPNQLAIRVDATLGEGWFYEGAGVYRNVALVSAASCHVPQWGICVRSEVRGADASVAIIATVANGGDAPASPGVRHRILAPDGEVVAESVERKLSLRAREQAEASDGLAVRDAQLWSPGHPALYRLVTEILDAGAVIDRVETPFGIRTVTFDTKVGFSINGKPMKLLGVCNHQDHAGVGSAIPDRLHEWRVEQSREMGVNAWRGAHNPPSQALLDVCDRKGVMMIAETRINSSSDGAMDELDRLILSSRNHPSIILWSVGNEEPHQADERGRRISADLVARCKTLDPTRLTTQAMDKGWDGGAADAVDVVGFNYRTDQIAAWHERHPDKPVYGSETGSTVATRGAYANDPARHVLQAYDSEHPWWASTAEGWWPIVADNAYIAGGFIWTGFDYRGEPTPFPAFPSVSSYFGVMDLCGFPKDNFYYYRAWWRPGEPLVHILPHWNWAGREGEEIPVWVHGNCDAVELYLDGRSLGRKTMARGRHLEWRVPYAPGTLEARGFNAGRQRAVARRVTAGDPARLRLVADRSRLVADGSDLSMLRLEVLDKAGVLVPTAGNSIRFGVAGPGRIIGLGNGDPTSIEPDKGDRRSAFNGLAQAIVQGTGGPGAVRVTASSAGLAPAEAVLFFHNA